MEDRARKAGLSLARAKVLGQVASRKDCWAFRKRLAEVVGVSIRTVQRALTQGRLEGLIQCFRAKKNEVPPGAEKPFHCGWSHRITVGRGFAGEAVRQAIAAAKLALLARRAAKPAAQPRQRPAAQPQARRMTAEQIDAELERRDNREREKPPD